MQVSRKLRLTPLALAVSSSAWLMGSTGVVHAQGMALEEIVVTAQRRLETTQETPISITALSANAIENRGIQGFGDLIGEVPGVGGFEAPGSRGTMGLSIRGVSGGSPANVSLDPAIAMYMDGVYVGKTVGSSLDVADLERIEVLRGPQGTLYGRNSTAGAVNFVTRRPTGEFGVRAKAGIGRYNERSLRANVDLPSVGTVGEGAGQLAATVGYQTRLRDGLYKNDSPGQPDFDEIDRQSWRLALNWRPLQNLSVDYIYDESRLDENGALQQVVGFNPVNAAGTTRVQQLSTLQDFLQGFSQMPGADSRIADRLLPAFDRTIGAYEQVEARGQGRRGRGRADNTPLTETDTGGHALTLEWDAGNMGALGEVTFKSITAHRTMKSYVFGDLEDFDTARDGVWNDLLLLTFGGLYLDPDSVFPPGQGLQDYAPVIDQLWDAVDAIGAFHSRQDTTTRYSQTSQEFQMIGATDRLDYALGLYYFEDESNYRRNAVFAAPLSGLERQNYDLETRAWAVYGQGTWRPPVLDDRLSITAGLRYTEEKKTVDYDYWTTRSPLAFGVIDINGTPTQLNFYSPNQFVQDDARLKRKRNFYNLSGTFTVAYELTDDLNAFLRYSTGYRSGGFNGELYDNSFGEEEIEQIELGVKSDWWNRRLRVNASLYAYRVDDLQVSTISVNPQGGTSTSIQNAGKAERWGSEIEILVAPIEDLVVGLSYAYINGDFDKYPPLVNPDGQGGFVEVPVTNQARRGASPSNQVNLTADYTFARLSFGDITGFLQVNWQDKWYETALWTINYGGVNYTLPHQGMDERTVVNARLNLENIRLGEGTLKIGLWGKNLTNDDYPTYGINFGSLGLISQQYGEPRTYGIDFSYEY